jgi:hypothetical protein
MTLQPGKSTRDDTIRVLGKPDMQGVKTFANGETIPYFAYQASGDISSFARNRIFLAQIGKYPGLK